MRRSILGVGLLLFCGAVARAETHIIVADHEDRKVIKIKEDGTLLWEARNDNGHDVQLLPNGDLLIVCGPTVQEIDKEKKVVHEIGKPTIQAAESAQRLPNGHTVVADNGRHRVVELDENDKIVWSFDVPNDNKRPNPTMRQVRRLDNGDTLICASTEDKVMEVSPDKKVVWSYDLPFPYLATRLKNGHTLISSGDGYGSKQGFFVIEVDKDGKTVWKYGGAEAPARPEAELAQRLRPPAQRRHAHLRGPRPSDPRGVGGQEDGEDHQERRHETSLYARCCG